MASLVILKLTGSVLIVCMVVTARFHAQAAISCSTVTSSLSPCLSYLQQGGQAPEPCCRGVNSVCNAATTPSELYETCNCIKSSATAASAYGISTSYASTLPNKCGLNLNYEISPSIDCTKLQLG